MYKRQALEILQGGGQDTSGYREVMNGVLEYLEQNVKNPIVGSTKGEWAVLALSLIHIWDPLLPS